MPIYEYRCDKCSKTHEIIQKFSDAPITQCPECGGPVTKQMSLAAFHLKGGGWYQTDYKKTPVAPVSAPAPTATGSTATTAPTPAPAAKPDPKSGGDTGK